MFIWWPPAVAGDACRIAALRPQAMILIDGLFDEKPAIRHKELLELIAIGVFVVGGASMGALRAAELSRFGMIGVGQIFKAFLRGQLIGDDEVALVHGPEEWAWSGLTEPLVNVRATLLHAARNSVISVETARLVLTTSARIFYKERTWSEILARAEGRGLAHAGHMDALRSWLPRGRVDLKRLDAVACLDHARTLGGSGPESRPFPPKTGFTDKLAARVGVS